MIEFGQHEMIRLVQQIWDSMLKLPLQPLGEPVVDSCAARPRTGVLAACVQITGAWTGAVRIDCSDRLARRTAAAFLGMPAENVPRGDMLDALGEVTNMVAGSVKPLLPRPCQISLPVVVDGAAYELNIRKGQLLLTSKFDNDGDQLAVSLTEATARLQ